MKPSRQHRWLYLSPTAGSSSGSNPSDQRLELPGWNTKKHVASIQPEGLFLLQERNENNLNAHLKNKKEEKRWCYVGTRRDEHNIFVAGKLLALLFPFII